MFAKDDIEEETEKTFVRENKTQKTKVTAGEKPDIRKYDINEIFNF